MIQELRSDICKLVKMWVEEVEKKQVPRLNWLEPYLVDHLFFVWVLGRVEQELEKEELLVDSHTLESMGAEICTDWLESNLGFQLVVKDCKESAPALRCQILLLDYQLPSPRRI